MEQHHKKQNSNRKLLIIGCSTITLCAVIFGIVILGGGLWFFNTGAVGGVRLPNQMEQYALDYLEENSILEPDEDLLAYYDHSLTLNGTEAAIITSKRAIYHKGGKSTAIPLEEIEDIQHRYENGTGDIIEIRNTSGVTMKIVIYPYNQGQTFYNVLQSAWERARR